jgi:hypothetical protein
MLRWYTVPFFFAISEKGTNLRIGDSGIFDPCSIFLA